MLRVDWSSVLRQLLDEKRLFAEDNITKADGIGPACHIGIGIVGEILR